MLCPGSPNLIGTFFWHNSEHGTQICTAMNRGSTQLSALLPREELHQTQEFRITFLTPWEHFSSKWDLRVCWYFFPCILQMKQGTKGHVQPQPCQELTQGTDAHTELSERHQISGTMPHSLQVVPSGAAIALPTVFCCCLGSPFLFTAFSFCSTEHSLTQHQIHQNRYWSTALSKRVFKYIKCGFAIHEWLNWHLNMRRKSNEKECHSLASFHEILKVRKYLKKSLSRGRRYTKGVTGWKWNQNTSTDTNK